MQMPAPIATPTGRLMPVDEMMHVVETDQADEDEIDGDDVVEQPWHDQDQDTGDDGDERRDMSSGDDHDFPSSFWEDRMVSNAMAGEAGKARQ